jgi:hypothetical protein
LTMPAPIPRPPPVTRAIFPTRSAPIGLRLLAPRDRSVQISLAVGRVKVAQRKSRSTPLLDASGTRRSFAVSLVFAPLTFSKGTKRWQNPARSRSQRSIS